MAFIPFPFAKMHWIKPLIKKNLFSPPVHPPPTNSSMFSATKIIIIVIILVVTMFLIYGLLHFLVRFLMNKMRFSLNSHHQSTRFQENGDVYQRQLQQLFNLHDGGLDQSSIDALPIFIYKELVGLNEPLHCAVCLCEFSQQDHLRLLPVCSHAFHIHCIDTWLLSNSTCPLCRGSLFTPGFSVINPVFDFEFDHSREELEDGHGVSSSGTTTTTHTHDGVFGNFNKKCERVYPVRLGKFRAMNGENVEEVGESSSKGNLDERRCYSMGSYEYVVGNSELQVAFWSNGIRRNEKEMVNSSIDEGRNGKEISNGSKGESFSVSKIWLWSKKHHHKFQDSSIPIWTNPLSM